VSTLSFSLSHKDTFSLSFSLVDENLLNFSFSYSQLLVLVTQVSHQNECDHTRQLMILLNTEFNAITQYAVRTAVG